VWLFRATNASVLDLRGARFVSVGGTCSDIVNPAASLKSVWIGTAPSTGMWREDVNVASGLFE